MRGDVFLSFLHRNFNVANVLTLLRILLTPVCCYLIVKQSYSKAFWAVCIAGLTDWLDGFFARKFKNELTFGQLFDPLADKILVGSLYYTFGYVGFLHPLLVIITIIRDLLLIGGAAYVYLKKIPFALKPLFISKVNTFLQLLLVALILMSFLPHFGFLMKKDVIFFGQLLVGMATIISLGAYMKLWFKKL